MLQQAIAEIVKLGKDNAEATRTLRQTEIKGFTDLTHVQRPNGEDVFLRTPETVEFKPATLEGFADSLHFAVLNFPHRVVRTGITSASIEAWRTDEIGDDWDLTIRSDELKVKCVLPESAAWLVIQSLRATADRTVPVRSPKETVNLFTKLLGNFIERATVAPFRNVSFEGLKTGRAITERGKSELGRAVEAKVQNVDQIPERIHLSVPRFRSGQCPTLITIQIDPNPEAEGFEVYVRGEDFEAADRLAAEFVYSKVVAAVEPLSGDDDKLISIVREA